MAPENDLVPFFEFRFKLAIALISWYDRDDKKDCMQKIVTEKDKGDWKNV